MWDIKNIHILQWASSRDFQVLKHVRKWVSIVDESSPSRRIQIWFSNLYKLSGLESTCFIFKPDTISIHIPSNPDFNFIHILQIPFQVQSLDLISSSALSYSSFHVSRVHHCSYLISIQYQIPFIPDLITILLHFLAQTPFYRDSNFLWLLPSLE